MRIPLTGAFSKHTCCVVEGADGVAAVVAEVVLLVWNEQQAGEAFAGERHWVGATWILESAWGVVVVAAVGEIAEAEEEQKVWELTKKSVEVGRLRCVVVAAAAFAGSIAFDDWRLVLAAHAFAVAVRRFAALEAGE